MQLCSSIIRKIVVEILKANSTIGERKERWWRCLRDIHEEGEFTRWISIGCGLGTLKDCDGGRLDTLLTGNVEEYKMRVYNMAFSGMWEYVRANKEHVTTVVDMVLDRYNDGEFYAEEGTQHYCGILSGHRCHSRHTRSEFC